MDAGQVITLVVAIVAAGSAYASQRAASRASTMNVNTTSRVDMEKEAYERARAFDTETIVRQDKEIEELRVDNRNLHEKVAVARAEAREARNDARQAQALNERLRERILLLERELHQDPNHQ